MQPTRSNVPTSVKSPPVTFFNRLMGRKRQLRNFASNGSLKALEDFKALLDKYPDLDVNGTDKKTGITTLMLACERNSMPFVLVLLKRGANVNAATTIDDSYILTPRSDTYSYRLNTRGMTALMYAAKANNKEILIELLKNGANVNATTAGGLTALIFVSMNGWLPIVEELLKNSADVNAATNPGNFTSLRLALIRNHIDLAKKLLAQKEIIVTSTDYEIARIFNRKEIVGIMKEKEPSFEQIKDRDLPYEKYFRPIQEDWWTGDDSTFGGGGRAVQRRRSRNSKKSRNQKMTRKQHKA